MESSFTSLTSDSLSFEESTFKTFETSAPCMTYNYNDRRCIFKDSTAILTMSYELGTAVINGCKTITTTKAIDINSKIE